MDAYYDTSLAVAALEDHIESRAEAGLPQMFIMTAEMGDRFGLNIHGSPNGTSKLVRHQNPSGEVEEATIGIQGIVCKTALPPFSIGIRRGDNRTRHLRQGITVTGLGSKHFDQIIANAKHIHTMFSRYTPKDKVKAGYSTISASNRFFTPKKQATDYEEVTIGEEIDPHGVLGNVDTEKWVYTEDNKVDYYTIGVNKDGETTYTPTLPIVFQVGDIVELQASLLCVPADREHALKLVLRSVALLDGQHTTEAMTKRMTAHMTKQHPPQPSKKLKRSNPYALEARGNPIQRRQARVDVNEARVDVNEAGADVAINTSDVAGNTEVMEE
ncbi:hypothetical protein EYR38_010014 [Pleurotus pulmonarius]|nr:hypothetical protein EYR38_010014 [Pleurotus pulmonarius]